jgi:hypothetical protein
MGHEKPSALDHERFTEGLGNALALQGFPRERMKGLEPSTFCMASRRSSQLSYIRASSAV